MVFDVEARLYMLLSLYRARSRFIPNGSFSACRRRLRSSAVSVDMIRLQSYIAARLLSSTSAAPISPAHRLLSGPRPRPFPQALASPSRTISSRPAASPNPRLSRPPPSSPTSSPPPIPTQSLPSGRARAPHQARAPIGVDPVLAAPPVPLLPSVRPASASQGPRVPWHRPLPCASALILPGCLPQQSNRCRSSRCAGGVATARPIRSPRATPPRPHVAELVDQNMIADLADLLLKLFRSLGNSRCYVRS